jgi:hypothetical protein
MERRLRDARAGINHKSHASMRSSGSNYTVVAYTLDTAILPTLAMPECLPEGLDIVSYGCILLSAILSGARAVLDITRACISVNSNLTR